MQMPVLQGQARRPTLSYSHSIEGETMTDAYSYPLIAALMLGITALLIKSYLRKATVEKEYRIPPNYIRVSFTEANMKIPVGSNLGKMMTILEDGNELKLPYHPVIMQMFAQMKGLPYLDETLGQDTLPNQIIGEIPAQAPSARIN